MAACWKCTAPMRCARMACSATTRYVKCWKKSSKTAQERYLKRLSFFPLSLLYTRRLSDFAVTIGVNGHEIANLLLVVIDHNTCPRRLISARFGTRHHRFETFIE